MIKIRFIYQSPDTDEPNKLFTSELISLKELLFENQQIDFTDGSYLLLREMEPEYTKIELFED